VVGGRRSTSEVSSAVWPAGGRRAERHGQMPLRDGRFAPPRRRQLDLGQLGVDRLPPSWLLLPSEPRHRAPYAAHRPYEMGGYRFVRQQTNVMVEGYEGL
jgi:hypothetical protein